MRLQSDVGSRMNPMLPVWVLIFSASMWGLAWLPLKYFAGQSLSGPMVALLTFGGLGLISLPLLVREFAQWKHCIPLFLLLSLVGGWGNTAYISALLGGDVVRVALLFYLAPVWGVLGGRVFLGERITQRRLAALACALGGVVLVVGGDQSFAAPLDWNDLLALTAGLAFSANNVVARHAQSIPTASKTIALFLGCLLTSALLLVLQEGSAASVLPDLSVSVWAYLAAYAIGWLALATVTWQWSVSRMEAGRSGVIAIAELAMALLSATLIGGAMLDAGEWAGAALIAGAALLAALEPESQHQSTDG